MFDPSPYVGLPFVDHGRDRGGLDCWGLYRLILKEVAGVDLPSFGEAYADANTDGDGIAKAISAELPAWKMIAERRATGLAYAVQGQRERPLDGLLIRMMGRPVHVGVVVLPGLMLHIERGINSVCEPYTGWAWNKRILGIYRHGGVG